MIILLILGFRENWLDIFEQQEEFPKAWSTPIALWDGLTLKNNDKKKKERDKGGKSLKQTQFYKGCKHGL